MPLQKGHKINLGRKMSEEIRKKISLANKGKKRSKETKEKISMSKKGLSMRGRGWHHSKETNKKISEFRKEKMKKYGFLNSHETRLKMSNSLKNIKRTDEFKKKISNSISKEKHWNWQGGITPIMIKIRNCFIYRIWRSDIFTRDNFTCVLCNKHGGTLNADHYPKLFSKIIHEYSIKTFEDALSCDELWNLNNGRTLCKECHKKTDSYGGKSRKIKKFK